MTRPVQDRVFRLVLERLVDGQIGRYHTDAWFHAECFKKATEITAALAVDHLLVPEPGPAEVPMSGG